MHQRQSAADDHLHPPIVDDGLDEVSRSDLDVVGQPLSRVPRAVVAI